MTLRQQAVSAVMEKTLGMLGTWMAHDAARRAKVRVQHEQRRRALALSDAERRFWEAVEHSRGG